MWKMTHFTRVVVATLLSISFAKIVNAEPTATLTVVVNGINNQKGEICMGVYSRAKSFPLSTNDVITSACVPNKGSNLIHNFSGLKPGNYAVAVVDDQNGDRKLNKDFFGIPKEGFGISRNPTVSIVTGTPNFHDASILLRQNTKINILMKYSLDS
ncbi:MAG TPA: DUF2141 domain-containing protein [Nodularia sp. (in: cyanobacteria)]|nr:DUF2141 domain-containing protein [Nodularia sp. (in: cyanobacteria)]